LQDTICLYKIYKKIEENKHIFSKYTRSLLQSDMIHTAPISAMNGIHDNMFLEVKNIHTIGDLYTVYKKYHFNNIDFENYLRRELLLYSNFYINNIIKQINMIHYLQT
jgi:hypothetical protein